MTVTINRQDVAAIVAASKFTDQKSNRNGRALACVRVKCGPDGLHVQASDSFRMFGYARPDAACDGPLDVCVDARALAASVKGRPIAMLGVDGPRLVVSDFGGSSASMPCEDVRRFDATRAMQSSYRGAGDCATCDAGRVTLNAAYLQEGAAALKSVFGKSARVYVDAHGGPSSPVSMTATGDGGAVACAFTMPVRGDFRPQAAGAFIDDATA